MRQWDIYLFPYRDEQPHPVVIISNDERCANDAISHVNGLLCTSVRLNRELKRHEAVLDETDGLDWKTAVRCDFIYALPKTNSLRSAAKSAGYGVRPSHESWLNVFACLSIFKL